MDELLTSRFARYLEAIQPTPAQRLRAPLEK